MNKYWGPRKGPEELHLIRYHDQDLIAEDSQYRLGDKYKLLNRRGWLTVGWFWPAALEISYQLVISRRALSLGWGFSADEEGERTITFHFALLTLYVGFKSSKLKRPTKHSDWNLYATGSPGALPDVSIFWALGNDPFGSYDRDHSTFGLGHSGLIHPLDRLIGTWDYRTKVLEEYDLDIPLPERAYTVKVKIEEGLRARKRWPRWPFAQREVHASIDASKDPLPHPGNSESDFWDGDDAIFGMGVPAGTKGEVVAAVVGRVLHYRERYSNAGVDWRPTEKVAS